MKRSLLTSLLVGSVLLSVIFWIPAATWGQRGGPPGNSRGNSSGARPAPSRGGSVSTRPTPSRRPTPSVSSSSRPAPRPTPSVGNRPTARPAPSTRPSSASRPTTRPSSRPSSAGSLTSGNRPSQITRPTPRPNTASNVRPVQRPVNQPQRPDFGTVSRPESRPRPGGASSAQRPTGRPPRPDYDRPSPRPGSGSTAERPGNRPPQRPDYDRPRPGSGSTAERPGNRPSPRPDYDRPRPGSGSTAERPGNRPSPRPDYDRPRPGSGSTAERPGNRPPQRPDYDRPRPGSGSTADRPGNRPPQRPDYGRPSPRPDYNRPPQYSRPEGYRPPSRPPYPHYAGHQPHYHHPAPPPPPRPAPRYYYPYDPYRYYGWGPVYRPYYPWWIGAANFGAGFAMGYTVGARPLYYYYPDYVVTPSTTTVVIENNTIVQEEPVENEVIWNPPDDILEDVENPIWEENAEPVQVSKPVSVLNRDLNLSNNTDLSKITKEMIDDSWKTIQEADTQFSAGEVREAIQGYSKVTDNVPVMPDPWFRLAFAEVSQKEYNAAMDHCLKGMELSRNWPASPFSLDYMYQENQTKKAEDLNFLEKTLRTAPDNSDLNMLAGVAFYSDGQSEKAVEYLTKAKNLMPDLVDFVDPMLKNIEESGKKEGEK